jgi:hypothetical protein
VIHFVASVTGTTKAVRRLTSTIIIPPQDAIAKQIDNCSIRQDSDKDKICFPRLDFVAASRPNDACSREELCREESFGSNECPPSNNAGPANPEADTVPPFRRT